MPSRMPTHVTMGEENMGKLDGKVAIVTGAGRGLGRAYARRLAGLGAKIAVTDVNLKSYAEFEAEAKEMTADSTVDEIMDYDELILAPLIICTAYQGHAVQHKPAICQ
jgi:NAD(P)-dependent dehydrogenase (short-subunit alcohol dehydrogenase family)